MAEGWIVERALREGVWFHWVAVTLAGGWIGAAFGKYSFAHIPLQPWGEPTLITVVIVHLAMGSVLGLAQWTVLRRSVRHAWMWIPVVAASVVVSSLFASATGEALVPSTLASYTITGAALVMLCRASST